MDPMTWTCHICGAERPDALIAVHSFDCSAAYGFPPGTIRRNIRYCVDRDDCRRAATEPTVRPPLPINIAAQCNVKIAAQQVVDVGRPGDARVTGRPTPEKESEPTPGPWTAQAASCGHGFDIYGSGGEEIAVGNGTGCIWNEANARLLAAAPELRLRIAQLRAIIERQEQALARWANSNAEPPRG